MTRPKAPIPKPARPLGGPIPSHMVGLVGMGRFIAFAARSGWHTYESVDGHAPCDYIIDTADGLFRVEVKRSEETQERSGVRYYYMLTKLDTKKFDWLYYSTPEGDYFIPASECAKSVSIVSHARYHNKWEEYRVD